MERRPKRPRLFGAVEAMLESAHGVLPPADEHIRQAGLVVTRDRMGDEAFVAALREGRAASFDELDAMASAVTLRISGELLR